MNFIVIPDFVLTQPKIDPGDKLVLGFIWGLTSKGRGFYGSTRYLAEKLGLNERKTAIRVSTLVDRGLLVRDETGNIIDVNERAVIAYVPRGESRPVVTEAIPGLKEYNKDPVLTDEDRKDLQAFIKAAANKMVV